MNPKRPPRDAISDKKVYQSFMSQEARQVYQGKQKRKATARCGSASKEPMLVTG